MAETGKESTVHDKISDDLQARVKWAERQTVWYKMRHNGLRRKKLPYAGAPDLHFPLIDTCIEKLKPFYYRQLFAAELMAEFVAMREQRAELTTEAAQWFDSHLKLKTNLLEEILYLIDAHLQGGKGIMRPFYNAADDRIEYDSIDPLNFIVPPKTTKIEKCGRCVHVETLTREEYVKRKAYNQDPDFIKSIMGKGTGRTETKFDEKVMREGLTYGGHDEIVIWNVWEGSTGNWRLKTLSPVNREAQIRPELKNPFRHGMAPFIDFRRELKEKGFYDSRGESEKLAQFEAYLCKLWNKKGEAIDFFATPLLTSDDAAAEAKSINFAPGEFVPRGVRRVEWGEPPFALDQEMAQTRGIAEQRSGMPDFGMGAANNLKDARTATEIDKLSELGGITTDLRGHTFRLDFKRLLQMSWSLCVQYKSRDLEYLVEEESRKADPAAIHELYAIDVGGSAESWNKQREVQKAGALFVQLKGDPYIEQVELRKQLVGSVNPRWVKRLVRDPQIQQNDEAVDEMVRIPAIMEGAPIAPEPQQNHQVRAEIVFQKLQQLSQSGAPVDPTAQQGLVGYLNKRLEMWKQVDGKAANAWWKQKQAEMKAAAQKKQQAMGGNVVPFAPGGNAMAMAGGAR